MKQWGTSQLLGYHQTQCNTARVLMEKKNADYKAGSGDAFANFRMSQLLKIKPEFGILLRMQDKMARMVSFLEKGELAVTNEPVEDIILDLINYSVILGGMIKEQTQEVPGDRDTTKNSG